MKKYALIFKCPACGKVVRAIAFNQLGKRDFAACVQTLEKAMMESTSIRDLVIYAIVPVLHERREAMDRFTQAELAYLDSMKSEGQQPGPQPNNKFKS